MSFTPNKSDGDIRPLYLMLLQYALALWDIQLLHAHACQSQIHCTWLHHRSSRMPYQTDTQVYRGMHLQIIAYRLHNFVCPASPSGGSQITLWVEHSLHVLHKKKKSLGYFAALANATSRTRYTLLPGRSMCSLICCTAHTLA